MGEWRQPRRLQIEQLQRSPQVRGLSREKENSTLPQWHVPLKVSIESSNHRFFRQMVECNRSSIKGEGVDEKAGILSPAFLARPIIEWLAKIA